MLTSKSVQLSTSVAAIVVLLATAIGCAQTQSTQIIEGSPLLTVTSRLCFANGCCYTATAGLRDNIIVSMAPVSDTPKATVEPYEACTVVSQPGICESETGLKFCPPLELGRPAIQGRPGGTCYAPPNIKYSC